VIDALQAVITQLLEDRAVTTLDMERAVGAIMDGACDPVEIAALLTALRCRGETVSQLVGAARAMRARSLKIPAIRTGLLDTCGTGGDSLHTFNISTATAFVAAACGVPVAKHGNRSASSKSGSADVLEALGVRLDLTPEQVAVCVDELGIGFCFAQRLHGAMKHAAPVRQKLGFRTLFNLLGPLTNPAQAQHQLIGVGKIQLAALMAGALSQLGSRHALVVCGNNELDEVSLWGATTIFDVQNGVVEQKTWTPELLGLEPCDVADLRVDSPTQSAEVIRQILSGAMGPARDIVLANTAAALVAADVISDPCEGVQRAAAAIDNGQAASLLQQFATKTQALATTNS